MQIKLNNLDFFFFFFKAKNNLDLTRFSYHQIWTRRHDYLTLYNIQATHIKILFTFIISEADN